MKPHSTYKEQANDIAEALMVYSNPEKAAFYPYFFKTGKGEYGEGDLFLGIKSKDIGTVVKMCLNTPIGVIDELIQSKYHEVKMCAIKIIVYQYQKKKDRQEELFNYYMSITSYLNNWDFVDLSAWKIVGQQLLSFDQEKCHNILDRLIESKSLWEQRIAIVCTFAFIRNDRFEKTMYVVEKLLLHDHDLIHKANGWMLREVSKRNEELVDEFIYKHIRQMPRTTLRYAIERYPEDKRKAFLKL
ncbi:MAG: DNA alkylation repair protein [Bacteroidaceae bacterium]